jgi:ribonucleotide monophosphatase NagD (HAD superfamily)
MLIDQFGVIHDGQQLYPGTLRVLSELKNRGIPVAVLTNSGKRAEANRQRLVRMGIPRDHFVDAISSGEVAFASLKVKTAFLIGKDGEDYGFDGITFVSDPKDAEVILILGSNAPRVFARSIPQAARRPHAACRVLQSGQADDHAPGPRPRARRHRGPL